MVTPVPDIPVLLAAAGVALSRGDTQRTQALCARVIAADPENADASFLLGVVAAMGGRHGDAVSLMDRALSARPAFVQALAQKAKSLIELGKRAEAVRAAREAARLSPRDAFTQDTIGVVLIKAGLHAEAVLLFEAAAKAGGQNAAGYHYNLASALQFVGRFEAARTAYRACLALDPRRTAAWAGLVQITRQTREANEIARLEALFPAVAGAPDLALDVGHALAKACEDIGDDAASMEWLGRAKAGVASGVTAEEAVDLPLFAAAMRTRLLPPAPGYVDARPIFVVGMPRTGTTLVERILTSHSDVDAAGELTDFPLLLLEATGRPTRQLLDAEAFDRAGEVDAAALGRAYVNAVRETLGLRGRFVDKLPVNAFLAPMILRALPEARVICLRRHPADVVLSNYRQLFPPGAADLRYTLKLEWAARYYAAFERMTGAFAETLPPDRYCEVRYEDVVADIEAETRRLLAFCDLPFEAACLSFHENRSAVATASAHQVRQPLYDTSVGRWKRYRPAIDEALAILVAEGCMAAEEVGGR